MTAQHFLQRLKRLTDTIAGVSLSAQQLSLLPGRLEQRIQARFDGDRGRYCEVLERGDSEELAWLVFTITNHHTLFMREGHHFEVVNRFFREKRRPLRIWSAASSTGEEAYSILMSLATAAGFPALSSVWVEGTDISSTVVDQANSGIYPAERIRTVPPAWRRTYFLGGTGQNRGLYRVKPILSARANFTTLNLLGPWPWFPPFDIIFCRNVLIYFQPADQKALLRRLCSKLKRDGLLILGHSEGRAGLEMGLVSAGQSVFRLP